MNDLIHFQKFICLLGHPHAPRQGFSSCECWLASDLFLHPSPLDPKSTVGVYHTSHFWQALEKLFRQDWNFCSCKLCVYQIFHSIINHLSTDFLKRKCLRGKHGPQFLDHLWIFYFSQIVALILHCIVSSLMLLNLSFLFSFFNISSFIYQKV